MMDSLMALTFSTIVWVADASWGSIAWLLVRLTVVLVTGQLVLAMLATRTSAATRGLVAVATLVAASLVPVLTLVGPVGTTVNLPERVMSAIPLAHVDAEPSAGTSSYAAVTTDASGTGLATANVERAPHSVHAAFALWHQTMAIAVTGALASIALVLLARSFAGAFGARTLLRDATAVTDPLIRADFDNAGKLIGLHRHVPLLVSTRIKVPIVVGVLRPQVLLPAGACEWASDRRQVVLAHELAHVARHDGLAFLFTRVATAVLWFHPVSWMIARTARRECERACDDAVLSGGVRASAYAAHLVSIAYDAAQHARIPSIMLALTSGSDLEERLVAMLRAGVPRSGASRRAVAVIGVAALVLLVPVTSLRVAAAPSSGLAEDSAHAAVVSYEELLEATSSDPHEWGAVGHSLIRVGELARAADAFAHQYETGGCPAALFNVGCALALTGEHDRALLLVECAILLGANVADHVAEDPDFATLFDDRDLVRIRRLVTDVELARDGHEWWDEAAKRGRAELWKRELPRFERVTHDVPDASWGWSSLGMAQLHAGDVDAGIASLNRAVELGGRPALSLCDLHLLAVERDDDGFLVSADDASHHGY